MDPHRPAPTHLHPPPPTSPVHRLSPGVQASTFAIELAEYVRKVPTAKLLGWAFAAKESKVAGRRRTEGGSEPSHETDALSTVSSGDGAGTAGGTEVGGEDEDDGVELVANPRKTPSPPNSPPADGMQVLEV